MYVRTSLRRLIHSSAHPTSGSPSPTTIDRKKTKTLAPIRKDRPRYNWPIPVCLSQLPPSSICSVFACCPSFSFPRLLRLRLRFGRKGKSDRSSVKICQKASTMPLYGAGRSSTQPLSGCIDPRVCTCSRRRIVSKGRVMSKLAQLPTISTTLRAKGWVS